ncbi:HPr kinase/phosphatase C-terminal domain-containing protein [uncultured Novosphingobium sp.]|uniref:HPr kinase/phosphorylase n=1 Tax=uncultured Novosphingobium sp. TaxID=292277 RepID=UPI00258F3654|nr:HPr kinase/phosphatase C-terminal domain-containing protein [uncultured Novosphingobium sp.]
MTPHIATCVVIGGRGVLIEGPPGSGKSALALALIDRGAVLVGDDGVLLRSIEGRLIALPHPRTQGLLEVRNLGILPFPVGDPVEIALLIELRADAPRYIEAAQAVERLGIALPAVSLWPEPAPPALKVELALRHFGRPGPGNWT